LAFTWRKFLQGLKIPGRFAGKIQKAHIIEMKVLPGNKIAAMKETFQWNKDLMRV